ncbi:MAG: hypothetical protein FWC96_04360 [Oscillospiraceae bacterium]|nr:hypothetical protein [Oscillospiraceae bacterium]
MMTFDEFITFRDLKIKNKDHERVVKAFYVYLSSVTGNPRLLPDEVGRIINIDTSSLAVSTGCFNGIFDDTIPPYDDVDFYIKLSNGICIFVYGRVQSDTLKELNDNEYIVFMLSNDLSGIIERNIDRCTYIH